MISKTPNIRGDEERNLHLSEEVYQMGSGFPRHIHTSAHISRHLPGDELISRMLILWCIYETVYDHRARPFAALRVTLFGNLG